MSDVLPSKNVIVTTKTKLTKSRKIIQVQIVGVDFCFSKKVNIRCKERSRLETCFLAFRLSY